MTVNNLIYHLTKYVSWLYFRHWERWELFIIVLISLVLLLLMIRQQLKGTTKNVYANQFRERSSIIGVKLADSRIRPKKQDLKNDRPASLSKKHKKENKTKEQLEKLNKQIQLLHLEIGKHKENETHLEQQITELITANKKLQQKVVVNNRAIQSDVQKPGESSTSLDKLQEKMTKYKQAKQHSKRQIIEVPGINKQLRHELAESQNAGQISTLKEEPLDVQKLKAIADLAKRIQRRRRRL
jgi:chromosome segregation ATPase